MRKLRVDKTPGSERVRTPGSWVVVYVADDMPSTSASVFLDLADDVQVKVDEDPHGDSDAVRVRVSGTPKQGPDDIERVSLSLWVDKSALPTLKEAFVDEADDVEEDLRFLDWLRRHHPETESDLYAEYENA